MLAHKTAPIRDYCLERVGEQLMIDLVLVDNTTGEVAPFLAAVKEAAGTTGRGIILQSTNPAAIEAALQALEGSGR